MTRPGFPFRPAPRWGTRGVSPSAGAARRGRRGAASQAPAQAGRPARPPSPLPAGGGAGARSPGAPPPPPAGLRRRGGGGGGDSPGGGGGARGSLPLSSPGRPTGPYLGPPRLGPWTACGWGMAEQPAACLRGERAKRREGSTRGARGGLRGGARGPGEPRAGGRWGRLAEGRRRFGERGDGSRFLRGAGWGRGRGVRGGEGRLGGSRRRARAGRRRGRCRSTHSSLFGGTLFVSHNALRGRPGWGRGGKWAERSGLGGRTREWGGARLLRKRRRDRYRSPGLERWDPVS